MPDDPNWGEEPQWGTNPFQTPQYSDAGQSLGDEERAPRDGPPWERDGASFSSFVETVKEIFTGPTEAFGEMRPSGRIGSALLFAIVGMMVGSVVGFAFNLAFQFAMMLVVGGAVGGGGAELGGMLVGMAVGGIFGLACIMVVMPFIVTLMVLVASCLIHLSLAIGGGSDFGFETTLRVCCYCGGSAYLVAMIPLCGQYIAWLVLVVYAILGIAAAHRVSGLRASFAVLLPFIACFGSLVALFAWLIMNQQPGAAPFQF